MAGYTDAEGYFGLNEAKARFKIDSYDIGVLSWMSSFLERWGVPVKFRRIAIKGQLQTPTMPYNGDVWRLQINSGHLIRKFIFFLEPYLRHEKRKRDAEICKHNIMNRISNKTLRLNHV